MPLFTGGSRQGYARSQMPRPEYRHGPWGEGIRYWLEKRGKLQAELAREANVNANTMSRATRGLHVNTSSLERIANALQAPIEDVLVSPERKTRRDDERKLIQDITERVARQILETRDAPTTFESSIDTAVAALDAAEAADVEERRQVKRPQQKKGRGKKR